MGNPEFKIYLPRERSLKIFTRRIMVNIKRLSVQKVNQYILSYLFPQNCVFSLREEHYFSHAAFNIEKKGYGCCLLKLSKHLEFLFQIKNGFRSRGWRNEA